MSAYALVCVYRLYVRSISCTANTSISLTHTHTHEVGTIIRDNWRSGHVIISTSAFSSAQVHTAQMLTIANACNFDIFDFSLSRNATEQTRRIQTQCAFFCGKTRLTRDRTRENGKPTSKDLLLILTTLINRMWRDGGKKSAPLSLIIIWGHTQRADGECGMDPKSFGISAHIRDTSTHIPAANTPKDKKENGSWRWQWKWAGKKSWRNGS